MSRLEPEEIGTLSDAERQTIAAAEELMGFVANDALTMARHPALMKAFAELVQVIYAPGRVEPGLKRLIGLVTSYAAGCTYCTAHTVHASRRHGIDDDRLADVWDFRSSDRFSAAEKAALDVALHAGQAPNGVTDAMYQELAGHFDMDEQLEIVAVIALFGFLNRWNSTLATDLEPLPAAALFRAQSLLNEEK